MVAERSSPRRQTAGRAVLAFFLLCLLFGLTIFCGWVFIQRMNRLYADHIYPNVYALGVDLGGMSPDAATAALEGVSPYVDTGVLVLTDGEQRWSYPWSMAGLQVDAWGTAQAAYAVGRGGTLEDQINVWLSYHDVPPRFLFDTAQARALLAELDAEVSQPPLEPEIQLAQGEVILVPGEAGRILDIPNTLAKLREAGESPNHPEVALIFETVPPVELDTSALTEQAEGLLARQVTIFTYDVLTEETFSWTLGREQIGDWLYLVPGENGVPSVDINQYSIRDTLVQLANQLGDGRGFRYEEAAEKILRALDVGETQLWLYLTHPERTYIVQAGDTLTSLSAKLGMPAGLVAQANPDIDIDRLFVGQEIRIPSQDVLTPNMPIPNKKIVVSIADQRTYVYENGQLIYDWVVSTGIESSPTHRGTFQVLGKDEKAYASQWDLWMPYFVSVYPAGGGVVNGFHELPILASGQRLWEGNLGSPASFGCIILGIPAAQTLYDWAEIGVTVVIQ
ncbi:MAG: L,D-transpeptidase family protein [Anaerolineae bacterium]|nr:L,D-transpeptidase family protein [Anaerolineae bacterium]